MSYEEQRAARVRRNQEVLRTLGLADAGLALVAEPPSPAPSPAPKKRRREQASEEENEPTRRWSTRLVKKSLDDSDDPILAYSDPPEPREPREPARKKKAAPAKEPAAPDPLSSKSLPADVDALVLSCLGAEVPRRGAYKESCFRALCPSRPAIKFNKYSGIAEFTNAIVLFVNVPVDGSKGAFENKFQRDGGRVLIDYFASDRMDEDTPVIARLRQRADQVVLFMRPVEAGQTPGSYYFMGRLEMEGEDIDARPMRFTFEITNAAEIRAKGDPVAKELIFGKE
ncbi:hypothetical protein DFJ74DRAFT_389779 [Hyaloraphidium curvatum]|nr:hypothetical protein DFJ74DRAFT_389779 [Hyaloraphidium curvatum]